MNHKDYNKALAEKQESIRVIYISSYLPRQCGIATFTKDLTSAINILNPEALAEIIAVTDPGQEYDYPWEVKLRIGQENPDEYVRAAQYINQSSAEIINLQHEFGLYGGVDGEYILPMIDSINKPLITCFHSILPEPDEHKKYIMTRIIEKSAAVIAMSEASRQLLIDVYGAPPEKAVVIYHGVPDILFQDTRIAKEDLEIPVEQPVIMVSGLLGPGKGFEYVIEAMPKVVEKHQQAQLYVVGTTHPAQLKQNHGDYVEKFRALAQKLNIHNNVVFVNKFLDLEELIQYFKAADIYITPHLDPQQPTSGTLAKALGAGKVCISTPYFYAKEMLANNVGITVPFKDAASLAEGINAVLSDPHLMSTYRSNAYRLGKMMQWPRVAQRYINLFRLVLGKNGDAAH